ncbi:DUF2610 domain-containing protein [Rickettsia prowazekii]|uniref:Uncharacterized protein RP240 n=2 Tax=Rickettsia prowazekii TaxID=782 RepID=Y240_RICPR|nr:DUF2610 domain-containing protein [Rickettsia prowazekii]Q9ZDT5.1 RecName: Full=Uncharacterized protein RP240 [Rickettsia prowazekii str. Madrid E]EOB10766.1 Extragenic suppressor protein SuhB [Rickettsia prowazekii str. GvF12]ADE29751.1 hypothetical protein rpr22_CDS234 [Rickettsia prowazekii str. Rp22]AFE49059.1 hypothetical protein M9W_01170 [Rickettsia prowazekii str. Chernikova]AFE49905.1 hypothetical protein M9Y_01175 [Rickettsia prowazekii str. Katsinyian]AFE50749.1 hypothetical pro
MAHYKEFEFDCDFGGQRAKFKFYIGTPQEGHHPLQFQAKWLSDERGGTIPDEVMKAISQLNDLAKKNSVPLPDLCVYALGSAQETQVSNHEEDADVLETQDDNAEQV